MGWMRYACPHMSCSSTFFAIYVTINAKSILEWIVFLFTQVVIFMNKNKANIEFYISSKYTSVFIDGYIIPIKWLIEIEHVTTHSSILRSISVCIFFFVTCGLDNGIRVLYQIIRDPRQQCSDIRKIRGQQFKS